MAYMKWSNDLNTGIDVIDHQHQRIVDYINQLHEAIEHQSRDEIRDVLDQLVEYTMSHFAFEEDLQEEAGYPFIRAHKKVHDLFARKMTSYHEQFDLGEDISRQLMTTLRTWLINHIKRDDSDYVSYVADFQKANKDYMKKKSFISRLLGA